MPVNFFVFRAINLRVATFFAGKPAEKNRQYWTLFDKIVEQGLSSTSEKIGIPAGKVTIGLNRF